MKIIKNNKNSKYSKYSKFSKYSNINLSNSSYFKTNKSFHNYKKSVKHSIKNNYSKNSLNKTIYQSNLGKQILDCYTTNLLETAQNLKALIINNIDNKNFEKYENNYIPFDKSIQGKSGAIVGYLKNDPHTVIKIQYYKNKPDYDSFFTTSSCLQINNNINEIFINNIFNNLESLNIFSKVQIEYIKPYILQIKGSGLSDKGTYILLPLVGFECKTIYNTLKYVTNLTDIIVINHKVLLDKAITENNFHIIELYDEYLSLLLSNYFKVIYLLQNKLEYINTDLKLNNIFVARKRNLTPKFKTLKTFGFEIDFQIIISDLEKSIYKIKGIKTITIPNNPLKVKLADTFGYGLIYRIRYQCISDFESRCPKLKTIDYDIIFMIINLLVMLHRNNSFPTLKNYLQKTLYLIQKTLDLDFNELEIFLKIISNNIFNKDKNVQFYLNTIITEICKKL